MKSSGLTVAQRLLLVTTLASSSALLIAMTALTLLDERQSRADLLARRTTDAELIALHGASAVVFDDAASAQATLAALRVKTDVEHACIYDRTNKLFAAWEVRGEGCPSTLAQAGPLSRLGADRLAVARPIVLDGETVGTVVVESNLDELALRSRRLLGLGLGISLVAFAASLLISWRYQRTLSVPLLELARTAHDVSEAKDYSRRVTTTAPGEIGMLVSGFNEMLGRIQERDHALLGVQLQLEDRVEERTRELQHELAVRKEAEEEVKRLNDQLSARLAEVTALNSEIESFSYSVSHDLRAPLRHVSGFVDLLRERAGDRLDETCQRYLGVIARGATQMGCLIDDLLGFSRMSRLELRERDVDLSALVGEVRDEVERDAKARDIEWHLLPLPTVRGDRAMLRIVFVNLISNAVKYSSRAGRSRIDIGWEKTVDGLAAVFVKDNGVGFDMRYVDKLFGVFQRLHKAEEFEGTGIGLATVRRIVNRHGGEAWAESEPGRGSTFHVSLALVEAAA